MLLVRNLVVSGVVKMTDGIAFIFDQVLGVRAVDDDAFGDELVE
jgi:hypothetical protein